RLLLRLLLPLVEGRDEDHAFRPRIGERSRDLTDHLAEDVAFPRSLAIAERARAAGVPIAHGAIVEAGGDRGDEGDAGIVRDLPRVRGIALELFDRLRRRAVRLERLPVDVVRRHRIEELRVSLVIARSEHLVPDEIDLR